MISPYASRHGAPWLDGYHNSVKPLNINTNHINHHARQSIRQTGAKKTVLFLNTTVPAEVIQSYVKLIIGSFLQKFNIYVCE